jgi:predicted nucleic acid-binding protein
MSSTKVDCFLDTNVLVYAVSADAAEAAKKLRALELIEGSDFGLSAQVLQEFYVTVTRKIAKPLPPEAAVALLDELRVFPTVQTDYSLVLAGIEASLEHGISYWEGAIVAAASVLGARVLYTEDLGHGRVYGGVRVENPFRAEGDDGAVHEASPAGGWEPTSGGAP